MEKEIVIKQSLTEQTLTKAGIYILLTGRIKIFLILIIGALVYNTVFNIALNKEGLGQDMIITIISIPLILIFLFFVIKKSFKKAFEKNPRYFTNLVYTINNDGFRSEGEDFQNAHKWENLNKVKITNNWYLIYTNNYQAIIIDKLQLEPSEQEELDQLFRDLKHKIKVTN